MISVCNEALLWGKTHSDWLGLAPPLVGLCPSRPTHCWAPAQSCEIHRLGPTEFISIDSFPYTNCNSVTSLTFLRVAFIFLFSVYIHYYYTTRVLHSTTLQQYYTTLLHHYTTLLQYFTATLHYYITLLHYYTALLQYYTTTVVHNTTTALQCYSTTLQYYTTTVLHCYSTTLPHYSTTQIHYSTTLIHYDKWYTTKLHK
jgi:hypothetical protein